MSLLFQLFGPDSRKAKFDYTGRKRLGQLHMDSYPPHRLCCSPAGFVPWNSQKKEREAARGGCGSWSLSVSDLGATSHLPQRYRAVLLATDIGWFIEVWGTGWQRCLQGDSRVQSTWQGPRAGINSSLGCCNRAVLAGFSFVAALAASGAGPTYLQVQEQFLQQQLGGFLLHPV